MNETVELATAYLHLVPSLQGAQGTIADELSGIGGGEGKKFGGAFAGAFTGALTAAAIGAAVVAGFAGLYSVGSIFDDVSDTIRVQTGSSGDALEGLVDVANKVATQVPASFEAAGDTVAALSQRLDLSSDTLGTVASQYLEAGRILGQTVDIGSTTAAFNAFGLEGQEVVEGLDTLFQVSQATGVSINDLGAAAQAQAPALQNLGFGFDETVALAGALDRAGINSTQTLAAMGKGLVALAQDGEEPQAAFRRVTGEIQTLIEAGDTAGAIDLASGIFGTRAANQFVGAVQSGTLALDDLVGGVDLSGDTILGAAAETADFAESWTVVKNNALAALEPVGTALFNLVGQGGQALASFSQVAGPALSAGFEQVGSVLGPLFEQLGPVFSQLLPPLLQLWQAFSPLSLILQVITPLLPQIVGLFSTLATTLGGALVTVLSSLMTALAPVVSALTGTLSEILASLLPVLTEVATTVAGALGDALTRLAPIIGDVAAALGETLGAVLEAVAPLLQIGAELFGQILQAVLPLIDPILGLAGALLPLLVPIITLVGQLLTPLIGLLVALLEPIMGLIAPLADLLGGALGFVVTVLATLIGWIVQGITWFFNLITGSQEASGQLQAAWSAVGDFFAGLWNGIVGFFSDGIGDILGLVGDLQSQILDVVSTAGTWLIDVGANIVQGLINGITGAAGGAVGAIRDLGRAMLDGIKGLLGIHSPSTVFEDEVGAPIVFGAARGVSRNAAVFHNALAELFRIPGTDQLAPLGAGISSATLGDDPYVAGAGAGNIIDARQYVTVTPEQDARIVGRQLGREFVRETLGVNG